MREAALAEADASPPRTSRRTARWVRTARTPGADGARVLTHCNTGSLALRRLRDRARRHPRRGGAGQAPDVWVDETRPVLQGARLTAWELDRLGIPHTLVVDGTAGALMAAGEVDLVVVGADRIAANGDVANKIGTYSLAVLAAPPRDPVRGRGAAFDDRPRDGRRRGDRGRGSRRCTR